MMELMARTILTMAMMLAPHALREKMVQRLLHLLMQPGGLSSSPFLGLLLAAGLAAPAEERESIDTVEEGATRLLLLGLWP